MKPLSINIAWKETSVFVKREAGLLFPIALGLIALPTAFFQAIAPATSGVEQPEPGAWMLLVLPLMVISMIGQLAIIALALGREVVVRDALMLGLKRCLPAIGAALLIGVGVVVLLIPFIVIAALMGEQTKALLILLPVVCGLLIFLGVRLILLAAVATAEKRGPVEILKRSWDLTRGNAAKLLGFILVVFLIFLVVTFAVISVGGIVVYAIAGQPEPGNLSFFLILLLETILNTIFVAFFATLLARIYAQLA